MTRTEAARGLASEWEKGGIRWVEEPPPPQLPRSRGLAVGRKALAAWSTCALWATPGRELAEAPPCDGDKDGASGAWAIAADRPYRFAPT